MNFKQVLKAYTVLRSLTDDETALLDTLRGLSEGEREQLVESLAPVKTAAKKAGKKSASKSPRASSLAQQIRSTGKSQSHLSEGPICTICARTEDYEDHAQPSPHFHEFQPPRSTIATTHADDDALTATGE